MCTDWDWLDWGELMEFAERGAAAVCRAEQEDCASEFIAETLAKSIERLRALPATERGAYLRRCSYRFASRYARMRTHHSVESLESRFETRTVRSRDSGIAELLEAEWWRVIAEEIGRLTPPQREIIRLVYLEGVDETAAADLLGIAPSVAIKRHYRAITHLRKSLARRGLDLDGAAPYLEEVVRRVRTDSSCAGPKVSSAWRKIGRDVLASACLYIYVRREA